MAEFKFSCPQCRQHIQCGTGYSGTQINCPACQQTIVVPPAPRADGATPVPVKSKTMRKVLVIAASVVALAGLLLGGWYGYAKFMVHKYPPGLVSLWSGDGNASDSVSGNDGTLKASVKFGPGKIGKGFVFSGRRGSGVSLGNPDNLQLQDFTIALWVKRGSASVCTMDPGQTTAAFFGYGYGGYNFGLFNDGTLFLGQVGIGNINIPTLLTDTHWHHLAATKNGGTVVIYVDGTAYPAPTSYQPAFTFNSNMAIGARGDNLANGFLGSIDEIGVFNRALSAAEIQDVYKK